MAVLRGLTAQAPRRGRDEPEERRPEEEQAEREGEAQLDDVVPDRREHGLVREVDLGDAGDPAVDPQRDVDLEQPAVPALRDVLGPRQVRDLGCDLALQGLLELARRRKAPADERPVVGVHDSIVAVPELDPRHARRLQPGRDLAVEARELMRGQPLPELGGGDVRRDDRPRRQHCRLAGAREGARADARVEDVEENAAEAEHRERAHGRKPREEARKQECSPETRHGRISRPAAATPSAHHWRMCGSAHPSKGAAGLRMRHSSNRPVKKPSAWGRVSS